MAEEMKNVETKEMVEETKTEVNEVEELKKLLAEAKSLLEEKNKPEKAPETTKEEPKGFFGKVKKYFTETSVRDFACDAAKVGGGLLLGAGAIFGGKYLYDNKVKGPKQLPGETYVPSEVVDGDSE